MFGAETWVLMPRIERALDSFMHGAARRIMGRQPQRGWGGKWSYPSLEGATKEAEFKKIRESITNRQNTVAQYITIQPLLDLCKGAKQIGGLRVSRRWWDQKGINWETAKARAAETESESEIEKEEEEAQSTPSGGSGSRGAERSGASVDPWDVSTI